MRKAALQPRGAADTVTCEELIALLGLTPLRAEGGLYRESYRSPEYIVAEALPARYDRGRAFSTAIYYLVRPDHPSRLHRLVSDEVYHFYLGDPALMLQLWPDGSSRLITLGQDLEAGHVLQAVVPRGVWQGLLVQKHGGFALLGTTVAPGFELADFEAADRDELVEAYPRRRDLILQLT
jgi:predicted cupin superfamily sugar epimerase